MDWKNIIAQIQELGGLTQPQIAAIVGCGQATVSDLANGKTREPRHSLGQALCALLERASAQATTSQALTPFDSSAIESIAKKEA
ncbi:MAG: helix-turn-helix transcriptional regulator [Patescibacteria group bacterium]|nr:helix-turn-helix transcriptional regulator [Patescibacteria group bacterium]